MNVSKTSVMLTQLAKKSASFCSKQLLRSQQRLASTRACAASNLLKPTEFLRFSAQTKVKLSSAAMASNTVEEQEIITICRPCAPHDRKKMIDFMSQFFVRREPLVKSLGVTPENCQKYTSYCIDEALDHQASFVAVDGHSGEICGLRVNAIGPSSKKELEINFGPNVNAVPKFLHQIEDGVDKFLGTEKYMRHVAICVHQSSSHCGIATDLMSLSLEHAKKKQLRFMTAMCSWKLPFKLATKMGYKVVRQLSYEQYVKSQSDLTPLQQTGLLTLAACGEEARLMVKELR